MSVPTYTDLYSSVQSDLRNRLGITTVVGKVVINAFAAVQAAKLKIYYLMNAFVQRNVYPDTADSQDIGGTLERFGIVKLGRLPFAATAGEYTVQVTGTIGATMPFGTTFKSLDTSTSPDKLFTLDTPLTFASATETCTLRALELGSDASLEVGDELQLTAPIANVDSFAEVLSVDVVATAAETTEDYREKVLDAFRLEAHGGARGDYRLWAEDVAGVRRVYPYVLSGQAGTVTTYVEATVADSSDGYGTPPAAMLTEVEAVFETDPDTSLPLNERSRRPLTATMEVLSVDLIDVDITITGLSDSSFQTAIETAIEALLFDVRPYVAGVDAAANANSGRLYESLVMSEVLDVIGGSATIDSLSMDVDGSPETVYDFTGGNIPKLNSVTRSLERALARYNYIRKNGMEISDVQLSQIDGIIKDRYKELLAKGVKENNNLSNELIRFTVKKQIQDEFGLRFE